MKKIFNIFLILCCVTATYSQVSNHNIDKIISEHIREFRKTIGQDAKVIFAFDYEAKNSTLNKNDYVLQPSLNPKKIKGDDNFFVKFIILNSNGQTAVKAINFRIKKVSRKHIEFINMGNGTEYKL
jgi:hypothetical protein